MKKLNKIIIGVSKVVEVMMAIFALVFIGLLIASIAVKPDTLQSIVEKLELNEFTSLGFSISLFDNNNQFLKSTVIFSLITEIISVLLMTMIFRNINLIFRTAEGKTKFSKGNTPFQPDNVRMVREIGYFCVAMPVIQLIITTIAGAVVGVDNLETSVEITNIIIGLVVLCLSQFFSYGIKLENDVEGLI